MQTQATIAPSDLPVQWQSVTEHTTQRGRTKAVLTGIPGSLFWHHFKHQATFRDKLRSAFITLRKVEPGRWEVVVWINKHNAALVQSLGFAIPYPAPKSEQETCNLIQIP